VSQATPLADWWAGGTALILVVQGLDDRRAPPGNGWVLRDQIGARVRVVDIPRRGTSSSWSSPRQWPKP
jgi:hypothetical protein